MQKVYCWLLSGDTPAEVPGRWNWVDRAVTTQALGNVLGGLRLRCLPDLFKVRQGGWDLASLYGLVIGHGPPPVRGISLDNVVPWSQRSSLLGSPLSIISSYCFQRLRPRHLGPEEGIGSLRIAWLEDGRNLRILWFQCEVWMFSIQMCCFLSWAWRNRGLCPGATREEGKQSRGT